MQGWRRVADPVIGFRCKQVGLGIRQIRFLLRPRCDAVDLGPEVSDPMLTRKAAKL